MPLFRCSAILFDLDGVLVDSTASVGRVWKEWAERHGLDPALVVRTAHGRRSIETISQCAPWLDAPAENRVVEKMEIEDTLDLAVIPGARELLASLPPDRWAVVTSGTRPLALSRLRAAELPMPNVIVTANEVAEGKPSPQPYLKGATLVGVAPENCLVFEDTPPGIDSGRAAQAKVVALTTTYPAAQLSAADAIIRDLTECHSALVNGHLEITLAAATSPR